LHQTLQFSQSLDTEQARAARVLAERSDLSSLRDIGSRNEKDGLQKNKKESFENYLYGRSLIRDASEAPDWQQTMHGRIATRLITRGVFGALAFTWAGGYANRSLKNYHPDSIRNFTEWRHALFNTRAQSINEADRFINQPNTMQAIAKAFDVVAGKPIQFAAHQLAPRGMGDKWAEGVVRFRPRGMYHDPITKIRADGDWISRHYGRSLGHEVVAITTDFAAASAADATGRYIVQAIDPNVEKDDEKTQRELHRHADFDWYRGGKFSVGSFAKDTLKKLWTVVSFNQGEDWAVAVPYAYFMKWHRNVIEKVSPGFKYASDHSFWNGASDKLHATISGGKITKLTKVGDFHAEGAWDLQARFTMYNVYTLMFRDAYKAVGNGIESWWHGKSWLPEVKLSNNPIESAVETVGNTARYAAKSFIKANIYMQPAVPFFWMWRVPQSKWRGSPIITNNDMPKGSSRVPSIYENTPQNLYSNVIKPDINHFDYYGDSTKNTMLVDEYFQAAEGRKKPGQVQQVGFARNSDTNRLYQFNLPDGSNPVYVGRHAVYDHPYSSTHDFYDSKNAKSGFDKTFGVFGKLSYHAGEKLVSGATWVNKTVFNKSSLPNNFRNNAHVFVDASLAYTPYMIAKQETALRWSNKNMDNAIYRLIDGALSLNFTEAKAGLKDIGHVLKSSPTEIIVNQPERAQDASVIPNTKIAAPTISRDALIHKEHRTLQ
jgi:hypothetical protein